MVVHLPNETELVALAKAGDSNAFTVLLQQYDRYVYRVAFNITGNREDAEDAMQEAFFKAFDRVGQFQGNSLFYTWLVRIAVNEALMKLRTRHSLKELSLDEPVDVSDDASVPREIEDWDENPEQRYAKAELENIISDAVRKLPAPYRAVYVLRDVEGLASEDAAALLGLSVAAVKSRLRRARLMMREALNPYFRKE